ncbi:MAG: efflux RND transporter periplasmic adaptor subunit [Fimbriimonadaceae bacterium]
MKSSALLVSALSVVFLIGCGKPPVDPNKDSKSATVTKGDIAVEVIETGTIEAVRVVDVKGRVSGRIQRLFVDDGDYVNQGQLIAIIDPQETSLTVKQNQAQVRGAQSRVSQTEIEISQRRATTLANVKQAELRLAQIERELRAQPILTQANVRSAKSQLDAAKNELERLQKSSQPNQRIAVKVALEEADANVKNAEADLSRQRQLFLDGYVSQKTVENSELQVTLAKARLRQAQQTFDTNDQALRNELQRAKEDLIRAESAYAQAKANTFQDIVKRKEYESSQADLAKAKIALRDVESLKYSNVANRSSVEQLQSGLDDSLRQLRETQLRAPMSGVISKRLVQEGELVSGLSSFSPGTPIYRLENRGTMRVKLNVNEIDTARLVKGMQAEITIDAVPGEKFKGSVQKIAPSSNASLSAAGASAETVVKYEVEVWITVADTRLRSGMSAKCKLISSSKKGILTLPADFVAKDDKGSYVEVANSDPKGKPVRKDVVVGIGTNTKIEIVSGLSDGDKVLKPKFNGPGRSGFMEGGGGRDNN